MKKFSIRISNEDYDRVIDAFFSRWGAHSMQLEEGEIITRKHKEDLANSKIHEWIIEVVKQQDRQAAEAVQIVVPVEVVLEDDLSSQPIL